MATRTMEPPPASAKPPLEPLPEMVRELPNISGAEAQVEKVTSTRRPVYLNETNLPFDELRAVFAVALHMHQPLIPAGGDSIETARMIGNLEFMATRGSDEDQHNASIFAECYARMGDIVSELVREGHNPRVMFDYSGTLLFGLRQMGRGDVLDRLRPLACDPVLRRHAEWLGTLWGHPVAPSTPPPDFVLHLRAWQQQFAAAYGWEALERVRGFSPPEMHLPNHPDVVFALVKALRECGYKWMLVQEHTVESPDGSPLADRHMPHRFVARNSCGEECSLIAVIKTQGSDTKLVAQMQPYAEAQGLQRRQIGSVSIPPIVTQIADGENGGVMMHEFPDAYRQAVRSYGAGDVMSANVTEYLELIEQAGVRPDDLPVAQPIHQAQVFSRIQRWEPGAADRAIAEIKREHSDFAMEGGSWTNDRSWVQGYGNVLTPMYKLSAAFHETLRTRSIDRTTHAYRNALFHLLVSQTSCFRYWGQGTWTEYAREICRRGREILAHDFR